jgi:uncharacterized membrane protein
VSAWARWRIAIPLVGLSLVLLVPAVFGAVAWWSLNSTWERALSIVSCLLMTGSLVTAVSIGVRPADDVAWARIGLVLLGILLTCGVAVLYRSA